MARPSKSAKVIQLEGNAHRTKAELAVRAAAEEGTLSGNGMRERSDVRLNLVAHKEFRRLRKLFRAIDKDDELYSQAINDYCLIHAECVAIQSKIDRIEEDLEYLEARRDEMEADDYFRLRSELYDKELKFSAQLDRKRDRKRAIEDKNLMNIQSALRSIPKAPETKTSALREALLGTG